MAGISSDEFLQPTNGLWMVIFFQILRFEFLEMPFPLTAVVERLTGVQNHFVLFQTRSAVQQQVHIEIRILCIEKLLQQWQCVGKAPRFKERTGKEIRYGARVCWLAQMNRFV